MDSSAQLETTMPQLLPCSLWQGDKYIMLISRESKGHYVLLPKTSLQFLPFLDGQTSLKTVAAKAYQKQKVISYSDLLQTVYLLENAGFIDPTELNFGEVKKFSSPYKSKRSLLLRGFSAFDLISSKKLFKGIPFIPTAALFIQFIAIGVLVHMGQGPSIGLDTSKLGPSSSGMLNLLFWGFILQSSKAFFQFFVGILFQGRFLGLKLSINLFGPHFKTRDDFIFLSPSTLDKISYSLGSLFFYISVASALYLLPITGVDKGSVFTLASLLTLLELSPHHRSELTRLLSIILPADKMASFTLYLKKYAFGGSLGEKTKLKDELLLYGLSSYIICWVIGFGLFSIKNFYSLGLELYNYWDQDKLILLIGPGYMTLMFSVISLYLVFDLLTTFLSNFTRFFSEIKNKYFNKGLQNSADAGRELIDDSFSCSLILRNLPVEAKDYLTESCQLVTYPSGQFVAKEGEIEKKFMVLAKGQLDLVHTSENGMEINLATLPIGSLLGIHLLASEEERTCDAIARTEVTLIEIDFSLIHAMEHVSELQSSFENLKRLASLVAQVSDKGIFAQFPHEIIYDLVQLGELAYYPPDFEVIKEGEVDQTFFMILEGQVLITKKGKEIARLGSGEFFGELSLMTELPRNASIKCVEQCLFLIITDHVYWQILSQHVELIFYIENVSKARLKESA